MRNPKYYVMGGMALTLLASSMLGGYAYAQKGTFMQPVSDWSSTSVQNKGNGSYCAIARRFDGNVILSVARNKRDETSVALDFDAAQFAKDNLFQVSMDPGAGEQRSAKIKPTSQKALVVKLGQDEAFYNALLKTGYLRAEVGEKSYSFNLSDIDEGKESLTTCLSQIGEAATPVASNNVPARPSGADSQLAELSQRLAKLESENTKLKAQPSRNVISGDPLKAEMTPELPLERLALKPLQVPAEEQVLKLPTALASNTVTPQKIASVPAVKNDQSTFAKMAAENQRLQAMIDAQASKSVGVAAAEDVDALKNRLQKLEKENTTLASKLEQSKIELASASTSGDEGALVADLQAENDRLTSALAAIQTAAGEDEPDVDTRELERKLASIEVQNGLLTERLNTMREEKDAQSLKLVEYETQVSALERDLQAKGDAPKGPDYEAMVEALKEEIASIEAENIELKDAQTNSDKGLQKQVSDLKTENELLNLEIKRQGDLARAEYEEKFTTIKAEKQQLEERLASYLSGQDSIVALKGEMENLKGAKDKLAQTMSEIQAQAAKLTGLEAVVSEKEKSIASLEDTLKVFKEENVALKQAKVDEKAFEAQAALSIAEYEDKVAELTLENEGMRTKLEESQQEKARLDTAQSDLAALKEANAELAALLDDADAVTAEQQAAIDAQQEKIASLTLLAEEGASEDILALETEIKGLSEENKDLKDELGTAQIELISLQQDIGKEAGEELEQALGGVSGKEESVDIAETDVKLDEMAGDNALDITEEKLADAPSNVDDIAQDLSLDVRPPVEKVEEPAPTEVAEIAAEEVMPMVAKAPIPTYKPVLKAKEKPASAPVAEPPATEVADVQADALAEIEPTSGDDVPTEALLETLEQEKAEDGLSEAQRLEMALSREVGVTPDVVVPPSPTAVKSEVLASMSDQKEAKKVIKKDAAPATQAKAPGFESSMPIEQILTAAQIPVNGTVKMLADVSTPQFHAYQWKSDNGLFGSAQQKPIQGEGQFDGMVQDYLTKTEERCQGEFAIDPSSTQDAGGTRIDTYEIACVGGGVDSSASLLFFNQGGTFTVVAHESPTQGMQSAMDYRDRLVASLKKS